MAKLLTEVCEIEEIRPHPNADRLEAAVIKGWQVLVPINQYKVGDKVVYFQPDTILSEEWTDRFGVTKYCTPREGQGMQIRSAKLRGYVSHGLVVEPEEDWPIGTNVSEYYGAEKYQPPIAPNSGDLIEENPFFPRYTEVENLRNYPHVYPHGEEVVITEKLHGTNVRIGIVDGEWVAGSLHSQRKMPIGIKELKESLYWYPYTIVGVRRLLMYLSRDEGFNIAVLFGETYGKVQSLRYGLDNGISFKAFDIYVSGSNRNEYLSFPEFKFLCDIHDVPIVPILGTGYYDIEEIKEMAEGKSRINTASHIKEGVVVKPFREERFHPEVGRVILKYVSDDYLAGNFEDINTK